MTTPRTDESDAVPVCPVCGCTPAVQDRKAFPNGQVGHGVCVDHAPYTDDTMHLYFPEQA